MQRTACSARVALPCIVNGDYSAVFRFFLSPVTLTFDLDIRTQAVHLTTKFHYPTFSRSGLIVQTNKHTDKQTDATENIHLASLRYAGG